MHTITNHDRQFHITDSAGDGPAIVFLHGNLMDSAMWADVVASLPEFRCLRFDFRLHGSTVDDGLPFTYWDAARDTLGVLDALDLPAAHLVGHSQGGFTTLRAALLAPDRITSMTLIDTAATAFPGADLARMAQIRDGFAAGAVPETAAAVLELLLGTGNPAIPRWLARIRRQPADRLARAVGVLMSADSIRGALTEIRAPALIVHGSADLPIPPDAGAALAAGLPGAAPLVLLDDAAHTPPVTHPSEISTLLRGFLHDVIAGAAPTRGRPT